VVRPGAETGEVTAVFDLPAGGEQHHGRAQAGRANGAADGRAIPPGQHPVNDGDIAGAFEGRLEPAVAVVKDIHVVLVAGQRAGNQRGEFLVVFDHKNPHEQG